MLQSKIDYKKAIIILGPRQVGKTTLINQIAASISKDYLYINGDDPAVRLQWNNPSQAFINRYIGGYKVVVIDEAQRLENIGLSAKMIIDAQKKFSYSYPVRPLSKWPTSSMNRSQAANGNTAYILSHGKS